MSEKQLYRDRALKGRHNFKELADHMPDLVKVSEVNSTDISYPHSGFSVGYRDSRPLFMYELKQQFERVNSFKIIDGWVWFLLIY